MVYNEIQKDLFTVSDDYYLAHCISADFALGAGIAVEFNKRFDMRNQLNLLYPNYLDKFERHHIGGDCILVGKVFNLITKEKYFYKPTIITMILSLKKMKEICLEKGIKKVAMPTIGAGLDRLNWKDVSNQIHNIFVDTDIEILVCKKVI